MMHKVSVTNCKTGETVIKEVEMELPEPVTIEMKNAWEDRVKALEDKVLSLQSTSSKE